MVLMLTFLREKSFRSLVNVQNWTRLWACLLYTSHVHLDKNLTKADMDQIAAGIQLEDGEIHADAISYTDDFKKDQVRCV